MRRESRILVGVLAIVMLALAVGCSAKAHAGETTAGGTCGTTRTAANVPVIIKVDKGTVDCPAALRVEAAYAARMKSGKVLGNGGGAPVAVSGWTCQSFPTPEVLQTGNASECHTASGEVLAVLPEPSGGATVSTGASAAASGAFG
jgi:hypothetical protein